MRVSDDRHDWRRPSLPCQCDPKARPTPVLVDAYAQAVELLDGLGYPAAPLLPEVEILLRHGAAERRLMQRVLRRWEK